MHLLSNSVGTTSVLNTGDQSSADLQRLGRSEGRALKSDQIRLAITPWCHVYLSKRRLAEIKQDDITVLANAFEDGLRSILED